MGRQIRIHPANAIEPMTFALDEGPMRDFEVVENIIHQRAAAREYRVDAEEAERMGNIIPGMTGQYISLSGGFSFEILEGLDD